MFGVFLISLVSASLEINSSNYSGYFSQGTSGGNISNSSYSGDSASFYQQAIGYLEDTLFSGTHGFSFQVSSASGFRPTLNITKPANVTYITRLNLPLNFTATNQNATWYNLDIGSNTTITGNTTFNTTSGLHTLYLFANNTWGLTIKNITFTVNLTEFTVNYNNYSNNGSSTNFNASSLEDLQNLSGVILEETANGKINFNQVINLTNDSTYTDGNLDLNTYTNISHNFIEINSTALPNFNKSATLYLYNLGFTNPRVLKNGEVCPSAICTEISYSGGTFVFNVTQFTNYSAGETPGEEEAVTPSGGGGGGATTTGTLRVDKSQITAKLTPGSIKTEEITITNLGRNVISVKIDNLFQDFVVRGEDIVILNPGESKTVPLHIIARVDITPSFYLGKIIVSSGSVKKEIIMVLEVESKGALLDVGVKIEKSHKEVLPGEDVLAEIKLLNFGDGGRKDIFLEYVIEDHNGNEIAKEQESLAIETQINFLKRISIPERTPSGKYFLYTKVTYDEQIAIGSDGFEVVLSKTTFREKVYILIIIILAGVLALTVYLRIIHQIEKHGKIPIKKTEKISLNRLMR